MPEHAEDVLPGITKRGGIYHHENVGEWLALNYQEHDDEAGYYCGECIGGWPDQHTEHCPVGKIIDMAKDSLRRAASSPRPGPEGDKASGEAVTSPPSPRAPGIPLEFDGAEGGSGA